LPDNATEAFLVPAVALSCKNTSLQCPSHKKSKPRLMTVWNLRGASLLQLKGQAKDKHWCFSVML